MKMTDSCRVKTRHPTLFQGAAIFLKFIFERSMTFDMDTILPEELQTFKRLATGGVRRRNTTEKLPWRQKVKQRLLSGDRRVHRAGFLILI